MYSVVYGCTGSIVEAVLQRIDRTWSGCLEPLYKLSTLLFYFTDGSEV